MEDIVVAFVFVVGGGGCGGSDAEGSGVNCHPGEIAMKM